MDHQRLLRAVGLAALCAPASALAQSAQTPQSTASPAAVSPAAGATNVATLAEVVVTAQRRAENIQTVPIAVTAIAGGALEGKGIQSPQDLQFAAPGLEITDAGLTRSVNIRGIGLASGSPAVSNGVATYVDGLFQPPILSNNLFYDIADIEVLRGPKERSSARIQPGAQSSSTVRIPG